jgi:hypothetical protein
MDNTGDEIDPETLRRDLHGEPVGGPYGFVCDYCAAPMPTGEPVFYEAIRVVDLPNFEALLAPPDNWVLDASRCANCELDTLTPATDGYDEASVMVSVAERDGVLSLDASSMTIIDYSLDGDGYYPPPFNLANITDITDYGYIRWLRKLGMLEIAATQEAREAIWEVLDLVAELPPELERLRQRSE